MIFFGRKRLREEDIAKIDNDEAMFANVLTDRRDENELVTFRAVIRTQGTKALIELVIVARGKEDPLALGLVQVVRQHPWVF